MIAKVFFYCLALIVHANFKVYAQSEIQTSSGIKISEAHLFLKSEQKENKELITKIEGELKTQVKLIQGKKYFSITHLVEKFCNQKENCDYYANSKYLGISKENISHLQQIQIKYSCIPNVKVASDSNLKFENEITEFIEKKDFGKYKKQWTAFAQLKCQSSKASIKVPTRSELNKINPKLDNSFSKYFLESETNTKLADIYREDVNSAGNGEECFNAVKDWMKFYLLKKKSESAESLFPILSDLIIPFYSLHPEGILYHRAAYKDLFNAFVYPDKKWNVQSVKTLDEGLDRFFHFLRTNDYSKLWVQAQSDNGINNEARRLTWPRVLHTDVNPYGATDYGSYIFQFNFAIDTRYLKYNASKWIKAIKNEYDNFPPLAENCTEEIIPLPDTNGTVKYHFLITLMADLMDIDILDYNQKMNDSTHWLKILRPNAVWSMSIFESGSNSKTVLLK